jgi:hypothetical protein
MLPIYIKWLGIGVLVLTLVLGLIARLPWFFQIDDDDERRLREQSGEEAARLRSRAVPTVKDFPLESDEPT